VGYTAGRQESVQAAQARTAEGAGAGPR